MRRRIAALVVVAVWVWWPSLSQATGPAKALGPGEAAQTQSGYASREEIMSCIREVDAVERRFEMAEDRIIFTRWNAPNFLVDAARKDLHGQREDMQRVRQVIGRLQSSPVVPTVDLLDIYGHLAMDSGMASNLAHSASEYQGDAVLGMEFFNTSTEITRVVGRLERLMMQQITAQETELEACRSRR
jgi:hypothetical protein